CHNRSGGLFEAGRSRRMPRLEATPSPVGPSEGYAMASRTRTHKVLVTGAGGFIGHHLVIRLRAEGHWVRGVDIKYPDYEQSPANEFLKEDLRSPEACEKAVEGIQDVYQLAADMGGIGYITANRATLSRNNILINSHMLEASRLEDVERYFYASSACVYPSFLQKERHARGLRERDAIPADPEMGYGWEKLFAEQLTSYFSADHGLGVCPTAQSGIRPSDRNQRPGRPRVRRGREGSSEDPRAFSPAGRSRTQQRQQSPQENHRLGAGNALGRRARSHVPLDLARAQQSRSGGASRPVRGPNGCDGRRGCRRRCCKV